MRWVGEGLQRLKLVNYKLINRLCITNNPITIVQLQIISIPKQFLSETKSKEYMHQPQYHFTSKGKGNKSKCKGNRKRISRCKQFLLMYNTVISLPYSGERKFSKWYQQFQRHTSARTRRTQSAEHRPKIAGQNPPTAEFGSGDSLRSRFDCRKCASKNAKLGRI